MKLREGWLFFGVIEALIQETKEEFREKLRNIWRVIKSPEEAGSNLKVFRRDWIRSQKMLETGVDQEHWKNISERYQEIVEKIEWMSSKENWRSLQQEIQRQNGNGNGNGWRSNWNASKK